MRFQLLALVGLGLTSLVSSCAKKSDDQQPTPTPVALTLPLAVDLTAVRPAGKTSFTAGGIDFTGAGVPNSALSANGLIPCVSATNPVMRGTNYVELSSLDFNCLIADVSRLPAMQKITVTMFDNGRPGTQLSLCDGSQVVASSKNYTGANPTVTYTLNVGGRTGSRFYIYSNEANIKTIAFE